MLRTKSQLILAEAKNKNLEEFSRIYNHENYPVLSFKGQENNKGCITVRSLKNDEKISLSSLHNAGNNIIGSNKVPKNENPNIKHTKNSKVSRFIEPLIKKTIHPKKGLKDIRYIEKNEPRSESKSNSFMYDILPFYSYEKDDHSKLLKENYNLHSIEASHLEGMCEKKQKLRSDYSIPNLEDKINIINFSEDIVEGHFKLLGNWIDLENSPDDWNTINSCLLKNLKDIEMAFFYNNLPFELFLNNALNDHFANIYKLELITMIIVKFILIEFSVDSIPIIQTKNLISNITEMLCIIFDKFVLKNISKLVISSNRILIEKIKYISRSNIAFLKRLKKTEVSDSIIIVQKSIDIFVSSIKTFSNSNIKDSSLSPIYNIIMDLVKSMESSDLLDFSKQVFESVIYSLMKKEEKLNRNYDIDFKKEMLTSSSPPFLPQIETNFVYTLVLDLDETLIHHFYVNHLFSQVGNSGIFLMRPGAFEFLKDLSGKFELVIFTAATKEYADRILNLIDPYYEFIKYRLYRHHLSFHRNKYVKDLNRLGRDISKVIIIDNMPENFINQPNNGLSIKTWKDDINDKELTDIKKILNHIFDLKIKNVMNVIKNINSLISNQKCTYSTLDIDKL